MGGEEGAECRTQPSGRPILQWTSPVLANSTTAKVGIQVWWELGRAVSSASG